MYHSWTTKVPLVKSWQLFFLEKREGQLWAPHGREGHFEGEWAPHGREGHFEGEWEPWEGGAL